MPSSSTTKTRPSERVQRPAKDCCFLDSSPLGVELQPARITAITSTEQRPGSLREQPVGRSSDDGSVVEENTGAHQPHECRRSAEVPRGTPPAHMAPMAV